MGEIIILKIIIMIDFEMNSMIRKEYLMKTKSKNSQIVENLCVENFWVGTWTVETKGKKRIFVENPNQKQPNSWKFFGWKS